MAGRSNKGRFLKTQEQQFLFLTFLLALAIGIPSARSVLFSTEINSSLVTGGQRAPAAIGPSEVIYDRNLSWNKTKNLTLRMDCAQLNFSSDIEASHLRLISENCDLTDVLVKNSRNGYTASIVKLQQNQFTTDFIELAEGENLLQFSGKDKKGQAVVREFRVQRRLPASNSEVQ